MGHPAVLVNSSVHCVSQGHSMGRCRVSLGAEEAIRAGTLISVRRMVPVVERMNRSPPAWVPAARVGLNAISARANQARRRWR